MIPSKIYSNPKNAVISGLQVCCPTMLDWVNFKNIMIPALGTNAVFNSYALMQLDMITNQLQFIRDDGTVWGVALTHIGNVNHSSQIEGNLMEAEAELQFYLILNYILKKQLDVDIFMTQ